MLIGGHTVLETSGERVFGGKAVEHQKGPGIRQPTQSAYKRAVNGRSAQHETATREIENRAVRGSDGPDFLTSKRTEVHGDDGGAPRWPAGEALQALRGAPQAL